MVTRVCACAFLSNLTNSSGTGKFESKPDALKTIVLTRGIILQDLRQKKILVTGGTGFIGKPLCKTLTAAGAEVFVLTRSRTKSPAGITYISSLSGLEDIDVIINLAGETVAQRWTKSAKQKITNSRLDVTASIIEYIRSTSRKPALLINASAVGYYGTDANADFSEYSAPAETSPFSRALCAAWETAALEAEKLGVRTVILRIGAVLEKDGGMLARLLWPFRLGLGGKIGDGRQWLSWIDRDDLVKLILHVMLAPEIQGPVNATSPVPVSNEVFSRTLAETLGRPCLLSTPGGVLRALFGDMAEELMLKGQKVLPRKALDAGFVFDYPNLNSSLKKILKK